ncbi:MAG: 16S rRNA (guanine(966)-N(2))-methyltransferase RsmD [Rickettsiales bacterium]|nr:16S rRNA (guanine(966)-N(2))-methyltransferase RsmD [Rickettsiales bacterium]
MAVTGGVLRGRHLARPHGATVRPTAARVREALFSILGQRLDGQRVLDLFAGTGTMGVEAVSRGAGEVVFVDSCRDHVRLIEANLQLLDGLAVSQVVCRDAVVALTSLAERQAPFDLVFIDPPYGTGLAERCLEAISPVAEKLLAQGSVLVVESDGREQLPDELGSWRSVDRRNYGQTRLDIYRQVEKQP